MIYEQIHFRTFGKDLSNNKIPDNLTNSLYTESINHNKNKNDILMLNNNSLKSLKYYNFEFSLNDYYCDEYYLEDERINNPSILLTTNKLNNSFLVNENIVKCNNYSKNIKEYFTEILIGLKFDENTNSPNYINNIFKNQDRKYINERNRGVVIEWLSYINHYFNQRSETLFMSINLMDLYISKKTISLEIYQLVGIASYLISSKYEDSNSPSIEELIYISKNIYTSNDIILMEKEILDTLDFDILSVSVCHFFSYFYIISNINNKKLYYLGHLILEMCSLNIEIMSYRKSSLAIGVFLVAKKCLQLEGGINNIKHYYNYNEEEIKEIQKKVVLFLNYIVYNDKKSLIMEKYENNKYMSVSYVFKNNKNCCKRNYKG